VTRTELVNLLQRLGVNPSRRLGQNFLIDSNLLDAMLRVASPAPEQEILEIGPGAGTMTEKLLAAGARVTAVELDHRLAAYLLARFQGEERLRLIQADACDLDYDELMGGRPYRCISNLPYAVSSVLIAGFLSLANPPSDMYLLLQLEMADRLAASPGSKQYGALSVQVQLAYEVDFLRKVPPEVFYPAPEVSSGFICLRRLPPGSVADAATFQQIREVVRLGFSQRRKKLAKLLAGRYGRERSAAALATLDLPPDVRAEALSPPQFAALAGLLSGPPTAGN
jgi:16S rRNA (adenine1518-N6/adenine1519-N6)-dimethyltransferase